MGQNDDFYYCQMPLESRLRLALPVQNVRPEGIFFPQCIFIEGLLGVSLVRTVVSERGKSPTLWRGYILIGETVNF